MRMKSLILLTALALTSIPAAGQLCTVNDTPQGCWDKYLPPYVAPAPAAMTAQTNKQVAAMNTGITNLISPSDSALKDFLTLLSGSLESATFSESEGQALTFDYNPQFEILGSPGTFKFQAVFNNAQLSSQLTGALASNTAAVNTLDESLDLESDVALSATLNPNNRRFGRSIKPHRQYFETWLIAVAPSDATEDDAFAKAIEGVPNLVDVNDQFSDLGLADAQARAAVQAFETAAKATKTRRDRIKKYTDAFATLLGNQSQLYASAIYSARKSIVGPNQFSGTLTFEWGPRNLSTFIKDNPGCGPSAFANNVSGDVAGKCVDTISSYAKDAATDRLKFSLEYGRTNRRWIDLPEYSVQYGIPRSHKLVYSLTYGRPLTAPMNTAGARIDLTVDYEDVSDQSQADNRLVGSATLTYKINDAFSVPIGVVYASHEEDLPENDEQLNAHFGLIYKMPDLPNLFGKK